MENFDFDDKIKQGLDGMDTMLDNDEIWENIEPHLKKKKKRRFVFWLFFGSLIALGLFWFQLDNSPKQPSLAIDDTKAISSSELIVENKEPENKLSGNDENSTIENIETDKIVNQKQSPQIEENNLLSNPVQTIERSTADKPSVVAKNTNIEVSSHQPVNSTPTNTENIENKNLEIRNPVVPIINAPNRANDTDMAIEIKKEAIERKNTASESSSSEVDPPTKSILTPNVEKPIIQEQKTEPKKTAQTLEEKETITESKQEPVLKKKLTKKEREAANKKRKKERKKAKRDKEKKKKAKAKTKPKSIKPNEPAKWKYSLQLMSSGIYTINTLKDRNLTESHYLNNHDEYVKGIGGFDAEFRLSAESPSGFIITSGVQYQLLNEKITRQETETIGKLQEVTETITENSEGDVINSTSSMQWVTTTTTYNQQLYNQYRFFNFTLGIGHAFKTNKMRLKLIGGIDFNAYYRFKGSMFDYDLSIIKLKTKSLFNYRQIHKNTVGLGVWASVEWHKPLDERLSLVVAPAIQVPLGSITKTNQNWFISQNLVKIKLGVGINYLIGDGKKPKMRSRNRQ